MLFKMLLQLVIDIVFLGFILGEASFTGSAGTHYYIEIDEVKHGMGGDFYFIWFVVVAGLQLCMFNYKTAPITCFLHTMGAIFVGQYGYFIDLDYIESNQTSLGWWGTLKNVSTLGNAPRGYVASESIHWAIVEAVLVVLVCIDVSYHLLFFKK